MNRPLRAVIVDDEAPAREGLRLRLLREEDVEVVGEFSNSSTALDAIRDDPPDLIFLDIEMPGMNGFAMLEKSAGFELPPVVFVTAHADHAFRAFGARALDYLLKPVDQARLHETILRARDHWEKVRAEVILDTVQRMVGGLAASDTSSSQPTPATRQSDRISVRKDGAITFVNAEEIDWIDAAGGTVRIHAGRTTHTLRKSMSEMLAMLEPARFIRIHRSTIVNIDRIRELQPWFHGEYVVVLKDGAKLKLSRGYRDKLASLLGT
ncbi:MAG: LytTR family DNA-binding domain-containing protein [Gemmatimonadales bacterium]